jgi:hypothetical protein
MRYERLLLGDWHPLVRDPIDLLRLTFLVGAVGFLAGGDVKGTANLLLGATAVLIARAIDLPRPYDLGLVLAMTLTGWGEALGLFSHLVFYDNVVHFLVPMLVAPVVHILFVRLRALPDLRDQASVGLFLTTFALGMAVGGVYEIVEWSADATVGSNLSTSNGDTNSDLLSDMLGSLAGAYGLVLWARAGWTTVRRAPSEVVVRWLEQRRAAA